METENQEMTHRILNEMFETFLNYGGEEADRYVIGYRDGLLDAVAALTDDRVDETAKSFKRY